MGQGGTIKALMQLLNQSAIVDATVTGPELDVGAMEDFVADLDVVEDSAGTSLVASIEDSFDGGTTWRTWIAFASLGVTGNEQLAAPRPPSGLIRGKAVGVTGSWTAIIRLSGNPKGGAR